MKVYKYGTGEVVPDDARYLTTLVEKRHDGDFTVRLVWHYFLVP